MHWQGDESSDLAEPPRIVSKHRHTRASKPIPIGMHHTVCGSEAMNLAKRLTEELASQQVTQGGSLGNTTSNASASSPEEVRSRSLEQGEKSKGNASLILMLNRFVLTAFGTFSYKKFNHKKEKRLFSQRNTTKTCKI